MAPDEISYCCEENLKDNCCDIDVKYSKAWPKYLEFEFKRSQLIIKLFGNLSTYLVLKVVIYHHFHLMKEAGTEVEACCPFDGADHVISKKLDDGFELTKRINYSVISNFTGLDKETVRRIVKKLVKKEWVELDSKNKILFNPSIDNKEQLTQLNKFEVNSLNDFVSRLHNN